MSAKLAFPTALILAALNCYAAHAQAPPASMNGTAAAASAPTTSAEFASPAETPTQARPPLPPGLSNWITYARPDCCGPIGGDGPIKEELYPRLRRRRR